MIFYIKASHLIHSSPDQHAEISATWEFHLVPVE